ncbi:MULTISPECIES: NAD(P)/FAD-dependent oxidoreductase [Brevibacterium]
MWDVIVVGAGPAGLGAARDLADAGKLVLILEARSRIGGRLFTDASSMSVPVERGAELVHGPDVSTWDLIHSAGLTTHRQAAIAGRLSPDTPWIRSNTFDTFRFPLGAPTYPQGLPAPRSGETALMWLKRVGISADNYPITVAALEVDSEQFDIAPADPVYYTVLEALDLQDRNGPIPPDESGDYRVIGGYNQILEPLSRDISLLLDHPVAQVNYRSSRVTVVAGSREFKARAVVLAVPGGVLQTDDIVFDPPLPGDRRVAIDEISYLSVFKGIFEFERPVLPPSHSQAPDWDVLATFSVNPPSLWNASAGTPDFPGEIVVSWMTGGKAQELLDLPEVERMALALESIRVSTGVPDLQPVASVTKDWSKDRFARGAYPGPFSRRDGLHAPIDSRLYWAGIVTCRLFTRRGIRASRRRRRS